VLTTSEDVFSISDNDHDPARLWEAENSKLLVTFQGHTAGITSAVYSPDGRRVLTTSLDGTVRLREF
jgi:WD40 repeat protein